MPGDSTYRVAADGSGRLLAAWEKEPLIHFFAPARRQHVTFPKPTAPGPDVTSFQLDGLELSPDGRAALVFMTGIVRITPGKLGNPSSSTSVYRIALDERTGAASPARLLFRLDHGYRLHASPRGAVFAMNKTPGAGCDHRGCSIAAIVAYEISGDRATPKTLFDGAGIELQRARLVPGSDDDRIAVMLDAGPPKRLELVRWRYGDPSAQFRTLPFPARDDLTTLFITKTDELVELRRGDDRIELFRHGAAALEPIATLGALQSTDLKLHGFGERPDGGLWLHWGDHLGLVSPGKPPRSFALEASLPRRCEWASADIYVKAPEHLWVGIDGRGRDFTRVSFADVERRAQPWPAASLTGVKGLGGEGDVTYAKDPSTATRLYATTSLRAVPGGLIAIGGPALRRLAPGASRWEKVHEVPGDSVYRVAADGAGRILASWEKEPVIHLFSFAQRQHVALPKPNLPFTVEGKTYNALHVDELAFAPNGRDAIVFTMGQVGASSRWITAAHYVALDGKSEPRPALPRRRGRQAAQLLARRRVRGAAGSEAGVQPPALLAHPRDRRVRDRGRPRDAADPARRRARGPVQRPPCLRQRRRPRGHRSSISSGGTACGDSTEGARSCAGAGATPRRTTGRCPATAPSRLSGGYEDGDFVEAVHRYDGESQRLEIHRYPRGTGEPVVTSLRSLEPGASPMGLGERADGGLWLQWGERLALLSPGKPSRSFNVEPLMQRGWEWAGAHVYVASPESLWVGLDGRGRQFVRLDLADVERRSKPWPEANAAPAPRTSPRQ